MFRVQYWFALFLLLVCTGCSRDGEQHFRETETEKQVPRPVGEVEEGLLVVKVSRSGQDRVFSLQSTCAELGVKSVRRLFTGPERFEARKREAGLDLWYVVSFDPQIQLTRAAGDVLSSDIVESVEYVPTAILDDVPASDGDVYRFDDPMLPDQWHYCNDGSTIMSEAGSDINLLEAWKTSVGSPEVIVAIVDGGVDYAHEDLAENMWVNESEAYGAEGVDDDGNGYVDDIYGYNFTTSDGETSNGAIVPQEHGTHVAGTVAAVNNNGIGVAGVAGGDKAAGQPGARLMSCQTSQDELGAFIQEAFVYAADNGAVIAQCSWGVGGEMSASLKAAIDYFIAYAGIDENGNQTGPMAGGLAVFAAGNSSSTYGYPAMYDKVLSVAAIGADYQAAYYTNYGEWVDVCAPGGDAYKGQYVISTFPGGDYGGLQGTSMACPHVSGIATLVVSAYGGPGFTKDNCWYTLLAGTKSEVYDYNPAYKGRLGLGMIDAALCLSSYNPEPPEPVTDFEALSATAGSVILQWTATYDSDSPGNTPAQYNIYCHTSSLADFDPDNPTEGVMVAQLPVEGINAGDTIRVEFRGLQPLTQYWFRIEALDNIHNRSSLSEEISYMTTDNTPPSIVPVGETDLTVKTYETGTILFSVTDAEGDGLTASFSPDSPALMARIEDDVLTVYVNGLMEPASSRGERHEVQLTVSDGKSETKVSLCYTVLPNNAPLTVGAVGDILLNGLGTSVVLDLDTIFTDPDGEPLRYEVRAGEDEGTVQPVISGGKLTVLAAGYGLEQLTIVAADAAGDTSALSFGVLVRDASRPADIYPNPVLDTLWLRTPEPVFGASLRVMASNGSEVLTRYGLESSPFEPAFADLSSLPGGIYSVEFSFTDRSGKRSAVAADVAKL